MRNQFVAALAALVVVGLYGPASATIIIDDFGDPAGGLQDVTDTTNNGVAKVNEIEIGPVGDTRLISAEMTGGSQAISFTVSGGLATGNFNSSSSGIGTMLVGYDGTDDDDFVVSDPSGLDLDLSAQTLLSIVAESDSGIQLVLNLFSNGLTFSAPLNVPGNVGGVPGLTEYFLSFSGDFGIGLPELTDIDAISINAAALGNGEDVTMTLLTATTPEPTSIALLLIGGTGCVGGAWRRRRRQRKAAA